MRMDSERDRMQINVEGDRLSILPDDLIHKILSFISIKDAIKTSVLSSRWRFMWTTMPYLNFSSEEFRTLPKFSKFVTHVLSGRNNQMEVLSVKLSFRGTVGQTFVKRILNHAFSHNVQQLAVTCLLENVVFPLSLFSSQSLKHLTLAGHRGPVILTSTWKVPDLTTLHLDNVTLEDNTDNCNGLFSKCANLKNLTLFGCKMTGSNGFRIYHPRLSNLTLVNGNFKFVIVVAHQLENLIIKTSSVKHLISAPKLASLLFEGPHPVLFSRDDFRFLEKVDLCISFPCKADAHKIVSLLQQLRSVKFLTLSLEIVELLSSHVELISHQPSPFANLNSLKIYPANEEMKEAQKKVNMFTEVKNYLLDSSPSATLTMVSRKEIRAVKCVASVQNVMAELRVLLDQEKAKFEDDAARMELGKAPMESNGGRMAQITSCFKDLSLEIANRRTGIWCIISKMQHIEGLLSSLPVSERANMQACFSSLCADADSIISGKIQGMKMQCDMKGSRISAHFHELATAIFLS